jgi:NAD(P)-dependent dehydrogenase (short-subunit alcohol dehydrogenase family)
MFADKTVVITGASSGLGRQLARDFASRQANCVLFARNAGALAETAAECEAAGGQAIVVPGDVTKPEDCKRLAAGAVEEFGGIDVFISNAGLSMWSPFEDVQDISIFRRLMEVNYLGAVHGVHFALPHLKKSGGRFVAIASIQSRMGVPYHTGYVASKHALEGFCAALRYDLEDTGVTVLTVHPHWMRGTNLRANACAADGSSVGDHRRSHDGEAISIEECSAAVLRAVENRDSELVIPSKLRLVPWLNLLWPGYLRRKVWNLVGRQKK